MRWMIVAFLALTASAAQADDCLNKIIGVAHGDCNLEAYGYPQDDVICQSYGLRPGSPDYQTCRSAKFRARKLTRDETDYGFLRNPLLPDVR